MSKGFYIADPKGLIKSPIYTTALKAKDICTDRNNAVRKSSGYKGIIYKVEECEIDG